MAFLDAINDIAKNAKDMTSDAIETTKLNAKISSERGAVSGLLRQAGERCYASYKATGGVDMAELRELMEEIDRRHETIAEAQRQVELIKNGGAAGAKTGANICQDCGAKLEPGVRFCSACGRRI